jgi:hypothetical protein
MLDPIKEEHKVSETMTKKAKTRAVVLAALGAVLLAMAAGMATAGPAAAEILPEKTVWVPEKSIEVDTGLEIQPGDQVAISADPHERIWSGVWFTGWNGPMGWSNYDCSRKFPLNSRGGCSRPYSLIAHLDGPYFYVGSGKVLTYRGNASSRLYLSVNDDVVGNGSGAFKATITVIRGDSNCRFVSPELLECSSSPPL